MLFDQNCVHVYTMISCNLVVSCCIWLYIIAKHLIFGTRVATAAHPVQLITINSS